MSDDHENEYESTATENGVIADIVARHVKPDLRTVTDPNDDVEAPLLILPAGLTAHSVKQHLDEYRTAPERRKGRANLGDIASFVAHAKRFADSGSALFANASPSSPTLTSVLDYHFDGADGMPRFCEHRGVYAFPLSDEWQAWTSRNGKQMTQADFAAWVEDRITDVIDPAQAGEGARGFAEAAGVSFASPSKVLELSRGLSVRATQRVQNATNTTTGEASIVFVSTHEAEQGGPLKVPGAFLIGIPVFRGEGPYQIAVRLRYRVRDGSISWFCEMYRADRVFDFAFREACELARTQTGLPLFVGTPEA